MADPQPQPTLTPQFCFSTTALRDFLRISRGTIDDSITQNLNALVTPAAAGFDPSSTATPSRRPLGRRIDPQSCQSFRDKVLFPSWSARAEVLSYCALVATSPDPDDPEAALREAENLRNKEKVVNERLDPYSARYFPREGRTEKLAALMRQERGVEHIVRTRSWGIVRERCGGDLPEDWEEAFAAWKRRPPVTL
ncbi:caffeine-induced death protein 2 [Thozetella sp. PMI_491]|nr:caffeine-induced death protein 2 [Thozetella sp. PMI_491]